MSELWPEVELGDVLTLKRGYDLPNKERREGDVPIVSSSGISGYHNEAKVNGPGVITGRYGTLGEVFLVNEPYWPLNTTLYVQNFKGNDPAFISYFLRTLNLASQNAAGAVPGLNRNALHMLKVRIPPILLQGKIAAFLSAYDDLIENNTRRVQVLEDMARALYREWFVEYRYPGHEQDDFVEDENGRRPAGWDWVNVADVSLIHRGRSYKKENLVEEGGMPFINLKCIERDGGFRMDGIKRYQGPIKPSQTVSTGDIVMGITDMTQDRRIVARAARIPRIAELAAVSMDLVKIQARSDINSPYLYGMLRFSDFADKVKAHANGANVLHLNPTQIASYEFALPQEAIRNSYGGLAADIYASIDVMNIRNANLRRTRDLLLPRLVSGELDVSALDIQGVEEQLLEETA